MSFRTEFGFVPGTGSSRTVHPTVTCQGHEITRSHDQSIGRKYVVILTRTRRKVPVGVRTGLSDTHVPNVPRLEVPRGSIVSSVHPRRLLFTSQSSLGRKKILRG